jgi:hypothetical protein
MTALQHAVSAGSPARPQSRPAASLWSRFMRRILHPVKSVAWTEAWRASWAGRSRPVFRITRIRSDLWIAERPGTSIEHGFPDLEEAVAFIRYESRGAPSTVELRIDDLYVVSYFDPTQPSSLFGESV